MSAVRQGELHLGVGSVRPALPPVAHDDKMSPDCALCGLPAKAWSGVEDWLVDGKWIGWCSNECRRRWFKRPAPTTCHSPTSTDAPEGSA